MIKKLIKKLNSTVTEKIIKDERKEERELVEKRMAFQFTQAMKDLESKRSIKETRLLAANKSLKIQINKMQKEMKQASKVKREYVEKLSNLNDIEKYCSFAFQEFFKHFQEGSKDLRIAFKDIEYEVNNNKRLIKD
jgi:hypothetical protein